MSHAVVQSLERARFVRQRILQQWDKLVQSDQLETR